MFEEIKLRVACINKPILLLGDFNVTLHARERTGPFRCDRSINDFSKWISDMRLIDLPLHGLTFTWRRNESKSRLDRALCCHTWLVSFPHLRLQELHRSFSDHNPLLLSMETCSNWGPKPFRSYDAWFLNPNFKGFLINEWRNIPNVPLHSKMKTLKTSLKAWRLENFDHIDNKINDFEAVIHDLERKSDSRSLDDMEKARLSAANSFLHRWLIRRERIWRQRARSYGFKLKDHNTKFFHASTLYKKKKKEIAHIKINGRRISGVANLKEEIRNHFAQAFAQNHVPDFDFNMDNHPKITEAQASFLETIPSREELKAAVWACGIDKALGFDGFNFKFIREMWDEWKEDIYESVMDFFIGGHSIRHLNITWVTLIPKVENPHQLRILGRLVW